MSAEELLELAVPKGHPLKTAALDKIAGVIARTEDASTLESLRLLWLMVNDADLSLYDYIAKSNPKMWNDSTFNGIRTWVARLKQFSGVDPAKGAATADKPSRDAKDQDAK